MDVVRTRTLDGAEAVIARQGERVVLVVDRDVADGRAREIETTARALLAGQDPAAAGIETVHLVPAARAGDVGRPAETA